MRMRRGGVVSIGAGSGGCLGGGWVLVRSIKVMCCAGW